MFPVRNHGRTLCPKIVDYSSDACKWLVGWPLPTESRPSCSNSVIVLGRGFSHQEKYANTISRRWYFFSGWCLYWAVVFYSKFESEKKKIARSNWKMVIKSRSKATNRLSCDTSIYNCCGGWNRIACENTNSPSRQYDSGKNKLEKNGVSATSTKTAAMR